MLYNLLYPLANEGWGVFNLFRYITFRTGGALLTALILSFIFGKPFIRYLKRQQKKGQPIREDGPSSHLLTKVGTPTMGGLLILITLVISSLLWSNLENPFVWIVIGVTVSYGLIGFCDDFLKVKYFNSKGISSGGKLVFQTLIALAAGFLIQKYLPDPLQTTLTIPFVKNVQINLGVFYLPLVLLIIVGSSNAVNLTDGLDGLAIGPVIIAVLCFCIISYVAGHSVFAHYLQINYVPGAGELAVFCGALVGAGIGFLWFNAPPAQIFMGDTGSLAMGGALGTVSIITKHEIALLIIGGLFVLEAISVIVQVGYFKLSGGKRIFLMAPLHHHFEKKGWQEATIVIRFWIIALILALIGLSTLKLR